MTTLELLERLIDNLQLSIRAKSRARSREQLQSEMTEFAKDFTAKLNFSIEESWISLTCDITLPYELGDLAQYINYSEQLISYKSGDKVDLQNFLNQVVQEKEKIVAMFQKINDSPNLIVSLGKEQQPLFSYIKQKLEDINKEVVSVDNCYKRLIEQK